MIIIILEVCGSVQQQLCAHARRVVAAAVTKQRRHNPMVLRRYSAPPVSLDRRIEIDHGEKILATWMRLFDIRIMPKTLYLQVTVSLDA